MANTVVGVISTPSQPFYPRTRRDADLEKLKRSMLAKLNIGNFTRELPRRRAVGQSLVSYTPAQLGSDLPTGRTFAVFAFEDGTPGTYARDEATGVCFKISEAVEFMGFDDELFVP